MYYYPVTCESDFLDIFQAEARHNNRKRLCYVCVLKTSKTSKYLPFKMSTVQRFINQQIGTCKFF